MTTPAARLVVRDIEATGVVAVIRLPDAAPAHDVARALGEGGVRAIEVTMTVPRAVATHRRARRRRCRPASSSAPARCSTPRPPRQVIRAGARFVVSPVFRPAVDRVCHATDVAVMPGCFTPTEICTAWEAGADIVKVFPATALGPASSRMCAARCRRCG